MRRLFVFLAEICQTSSSGFQPKFIKRRISTWYLVKGCGQFFTARNMVSKKSATQAGGSVHGFLLEGCSGKAQNRDVWDEIVGSEVLCCISGRWFKVGLRKCAGQLGELFRQKSKLKCVRWNHRVYMGSEVLWCILGRWLRMDLQTCPVQLEDMLNNGPQINKPWFMKIVGVPVYPSNINGDMILVKWHPPIEQLFGVYSSRATSTQNGNPWDAPSQNSLHIWYKFGFLCNSVGKYSKHFG